MLDVMPKKFSRRRLTGVAIGLAAIAAMAGSASAAGRRAAEERPPSTDPFPECAVLYAGQHLHAGEVCVEIGEEDIEVRYSMADGWELEDLHVAAESTIGDVPANKSGTPTIGHFAGTESETVDGGEVVTLPRPDGDHLVVAAHAVVSGPRGSETAWADGTEFSSKRWGTYMEGVVSISESPAPSTTNPTTTVSQGIDF